MNYKYRKEEHSKIIEEYEKINANKLILGNYKHNYYVMKVRNAKERIDERFKKIEDEGRDDLILCFVTLTFGKQKNENGKSKTYEEYDTKSVTNALSQLHHIFEHYICIKERGEKNGRLHYHLMVWTKYSLRTLRDKIRDIWYFGQMNEKSVQIARCQKAIGNYLTKYMKKGYIGRMTSDIALDKKKTKHALIMEQLQALEEQGKKDTDEYSLLEQRAIDIEIFIGDYIQPVLKIVYPWEMKVSPHSKCNED